MEAAIAPADDCLIGAGFTYCLDISFEAKDMFGAIEKDLALLEDVVP